MMHLALALVLASIGQSRDRSPRPPLGEPAWGWTTPRDGSAPAGWYRVRRDADGTYHVFAADQPTGRIAPTPAANYGLDMGHQHGGPGEIRGTDFRLGRELARSLAAPTEAPPPASPPASRPAPAGPCPGPGPCPSPKKPDPKPVPAPSHAAPSLPTIYIAVGVAVSLALAGLVVAGALALGLLMWMRSQ